MKNLLFVLLIFLSSLSAQEQDAKIHEELRALLKGIETAVNTKQYSNLPQYFNKDLQVTVVNQNILSSHSDIINYFEEWFGKGGYIKSLNMSLTPDEKTIFYNDKTMGIVRGSGIEQYKLSDGRDLNLHTRWTATLIKDIDGKWRILTLHLGTNFYDNAIYNEMEKELKKWIILGSIGGVIIGLFLGLLLYFRKVKGN